MPVTIASRRARGHSATLLVLSLALACVPAEPARGQSAPATPAPGQIIQIGDHRMHIHCTGPERATPTVVLEAGGGAYSAMWSRVQDSLAGRVRSCAYDRAGLGWSEPGPAPRTMRQEVFELHELLSAARIAGPFVLVGHSIGGIDVRVYADQYGADVAGMVLVDPTHESTVLYNTRVGRWARIRELATGRAIPEPRREGKPAAGYDPNTDFFADELQAVHENRRKNPQPLGDRPLIVIAAGRRPAPPGTPDSLWRELRREKEEQVRDVAQLSRNSRFVADSTSGHQIPSENPALVARAIEAVTAAVRARAPIEW